MTLLIKNFGIAGYRSFGKEPQYFERLGKINLLIGKNNAGKSNAIRFLTEIYPKSARPARPTIDPLDLHQPDRPQLLVGWGEELIKNADSKHFLSTEHRAISGFTDPQITTFSELLGRAFAEKSQLDGTKHTWHLLPLPELKDPSPNWSKAFKTLSDSEIQNLWHHMTGINGGDRIRDWEPGIMARLVPQFHDFNSAFIPAVREVGPQRSDSSGFDGTGLVERLARLQNPDVHDQLDRKKFEGITNFLRTVIDNATATIEVPHNRETILVHMDGKTLPLSSLGSGIQEVLILASTATVLSNHLVCIEEPEIHLNPLLQKKLVRYLASHTENQYIISTHSAALMDTPGAEIYHIQLQNGCSVVHRVSSSGQRSAVCEDLGYHPSDLLQANCVIWVEGPSDRIYLKKWLATLRPEFIEGIQYSIMFYGGRLAAHLTNDDITSSIDDFISLRRLNQRGVILLDSDKPAEHAPINDTKLRLKSEFEKGPGHAWITEGREIENYLPRVQLEAALSNIRPKAKQLSSFEKFEHVLEIEGKSGKTVQAPKVEVARYIVENFVPDFSILDLKTNVEKLITFIDGSNPNATHQ